MKKTTKNLLGLVIGATLSVATPLAILPAASTFATDLPAYDLPTGEEVARAKYSFYLDDVVISEQYVTDGDFLYEPEAAVKDNQYFVGWFDEDGYPVDFWSSVEVAENTEVKITGVYAESGILAQFTRKIDDKDVVIASEVTEDGQINLSEVSIDLALDEYLQGWKKDGVILSADQTVTISENSVFEAVVGKKVWVSFDTNGGTATPAVAVIPGSTVTKPADPTKAGYEFVEWREGGENGTRFDFAKPITADTELTAKYNPGTAPYTIVIYRENTEGVMKAVQVITERDEVESGSTVKVTANDADIKDSFSDFDYYEPVTAEVEAEVKGDGSTIIEYQFKRKEYTFEFNFGSNTGNHRPRYVVYGNNSQYNQGSNYVIKAKLGDDVSSIWPKSVGHIRQGNGGNSTRYFRSWQTTDLATNYSGFPMTTRVGGNIQTITPEILSKTKTTITFNLETMNNNGNPYSSQTSTWQPATSEELSNDDVPSSADPETVYYTVTFDLDGGDGDAEDMRVEAGTKATAPSEPTKDNYVFGGWKDKDTETLFDFDKVIIAKDTNLIATWIPETEIVQLCYVGADDEPVYDSLLYALGTHVIIPAYTGSYETEEGTIYGAFTGWNLFGEHTPSTDSYWMYWLFKLFPNYFWKVGSLSIRPGLLGATAQRAISNVLPLYATFDYPQEMADITYFANDGTDTSEYFGDLQYNNYEVAENMFTRDGYKFLGWNTMADGSGIMYQPGDILALKESDEDLPNELYAIWEKIEEAPAFENPVTYDGISLYVFTFIVATMMAGGVFFAKRRS